MTGAVRSAVVVAEFRGEFMEESLLSDEDAVGAAGCEVEDDAEDGQDGDVDREDPGEVHGLEPDQQVGGGAAEESDADPVAERDAGAAACSWASGTVLTTL